MARWAGAVRYARCGEPKQHYPSSELCSDVATGERLEFESLTSRSERGGWTSAASWEDARWPPTLPSSDSGEVATRSRTSSCYDLLSKDVT